MVTARLETDCVGRFAALLEVAIAPTPLTSDEGIAEGSRAASYLSDLASTDIRRCRGAG